MELRLKASLSAFGSSSLILESNITVFSLPEDVSSFSIGCGVFDSPAYYYAWFLNEDLIVGHFLLNREVADVFPKKEDYTFGSILEPTEYGDTFSYIALNRETTSDDFGLFTCAATCQARDHLDNLTAIDFKLDVLIVRQGTNTYIIYIYKGSISLNIYTYIYKQLRMYIYQRIQ